MHIFNTLSKRRELLGSKVKIFVCGPTLYDYLHLGHARLFIVVDTLVKYLRFRACADTYLLVNVTDVDPKIDERAKAEGLDTGSIALKYSEEMIRDLRLVDALDSIDALAYVSDYIDYANQCIDKLIDKGYAYRLADRVYFDIYHAYKYGYGLLSCSSIDEVMSKPLDMLKGKKSMADILLQYSKRYPYWHIQDTSVALANYYCNYDIHVGSRDLIYPHHEAYIAQCSALTNGNYRVGAFMHLGLLKVGGRKMSKSYKNVLRLRDMVVKYGYKALRLYMLAEHYREDMEFDTHRLGRFSELAMRIDARLMDNDSSNSNSSYLNAFDEYMSDDLATDKVIDMLYNNLEEISTNTLKVIADVLF